MKTLYLIRGIPGSGKSTLACSLAKRNVCEADQYFLDAEGNYNFNPLKLATAHKWCQERAGVLMRKGLKKIAVANTFIRLWEMKWYARTAIENGYNVEVIECKGEYQNIHGVSDEKIAEMKKNYECYHGLHQLLNDYQRPVDAVRVRNTALVRKGSSSSISQPRKIKE